MALSADFDSEFYFDINQYLISNYSKMSLPDRRAICSLALEALESESLEEQIDAVVAQYALEKLKYIDPDE